MRTIAAFNYLFAAAAFFLPWIDVRCDSGSLGSRCVAFQSGCDAAAGWYSPDECFADATSSAARRGISITGTEAPFGNRAGVESQPLLVAYFIAILLGLVCCLLVRSRRWRLAVLIVTLVSIILLAVPTVLGFPIASDHRFALYRASIQDHTRIRVAYSYGFYIAWGLTVTPLLLLLIDSGLSRPRKHIPRHLDSEDAILE